MTNSLMRSELLRLASRKASDPPSAHTMHPPLRASQEGFSPRRAAGINLAASNQRQIAVECGRLNLYS